MLKCKIGVVRRNLTCSAHVSKLVTFTGDDLWYSVRGGGLNSKQGGFGGGSVLRERVNFWENTVYGHGGTAQIFAGLNFDHDRFEKGTVSELNPAERDRPLIKKKEDRQISTADKVVTYKNWTRDYYLNKQNMGFSNTQLVGRYIPNMFPSDAMKEFGRTFDDFRCVILDLGRVSSMSPKLGRIYKRRSTVMVGNGNGVFGIATCQTDDIIEGIVLARSNAFKNLQYVHLDEGRTLSSDGYYHFHKTIINLRRQPKGFGIRGDRITKRMADVIGLKDIDINVTGSKTPLSLINCFCRALEEAETDQERADLNGYYVVEIDPQRGDKPKVLATPRKGERRIPFPQDKLFFNQRFNIHDFNAAYSGLVQGGRMPAYNRVEPGRTGSGYAGFMPYVQRSWDLTTRAKAPANLQKEKRIYSNMSRSKIDSEMIDSVLQA